MHDSAIPWIDFTALSHALAYKAQKGVPKIFFRKVVHNHSKKQMAVAIHAHHGFVYGLYVGHFITHFQERLNS